MKKKQKKPEKSKMVLPGWMASYADMFTVLMAFFVLLFAMSIVDEELFQEFIASFNPARAEDMALLIGGGGDIIGPDNPGFFPGETPPPAIEGQEEDEGLEGEPGYPGEGDTVADLYNTFMTYMADLLGDHGEWGGAFTVEQGPSFVLITLPDVYGLTFPSGSAVLTQYAIDALNELGPTLAQLSAEGHGIFIEGHTDSQPINTAQFPNNTFLGSARAAAAWTFLTGEWGLSPYITRAVGMGEYFPVADNATPEGRAANRRLEIKVFTETATGEMIPGHMPSAHWTIPR